MHKTTENRQRWEQMKHLYVLTTPDSLIFSYKTLSKNNSLEKSILEMINPIEFNGDLIQFEFVSKKYKKLQLKNGSLDYPKLPKDFFFEKLRTVIGDPLMTEKILKINSENFENKKGYEITLGKLNYVII